MGHVRHVGYPGVPTLLIEVQDSTHECVEAGDVLDGGSMYCAIALAMVSWPYSTPELRVFNALNVKRD